MKGRGLHVTTQIASYTRGAPYLSVLAVREESFCRASRRHAEAREGPTFCTFSPVAQALAG